MASAVVLLLLLCFLPSTFAVIPKACVGNITSSPAVCCPVPAGFDQPCGGPERGVCERVQLYRAVLMEKYQHFYFQDLRFRWPEREFQYLCKCQSTFFGPGCGECWFGYEGHNCDRRVIRKRKSIMTLNATERRQFVEISMKLREDKSDYVVPKPDLKNLRWTDEYIEVDPFEKVVYEHYLGSIPELNKTTNHCRRIENAKWDWGHDGGGFVSYHRYINMLIEREYQKVASKFFGIEDFAMPYWDWTNSQICDPCVDDLIGAPTKEFDEATSAYFVSRKSPFGTSRWKTFCADKENVKDKCAPCNMDRNRPSRLSRHFFRQNFPTVDEVIEFLGLTTYHNFTDLCSDAESMLETGRNCTCRWKGMRNTLHAKLHNMIHGTMDPLSASIYDPVFTLHHTQVDRLFERWRRAVLPPKNDFANHGRSPIQCRDCYMPPFIPAVKFGDVFVDTREIGYTYDNFDFGSLSEKVKIARWNSPYHNKPCDKYQMTDPLPKHPKT